MSLRRAARVFACLAFASFAASSSVRADEAIEVDHAPELTTKVYQVADLIVPLASKEAGEAHADFEWLVDLIELRTGADCWPQGRGLGVITPHEKTMSLIIRQTSATHERIADVLDEIRGTADLGLCVEIQLIHGNLDACGESKPHRTAQGLVDAAGKQRLLQALQGQKDGKVIAAPKITFFNGTTASMETTEEGGTKAFNIRGVISKDNRYARLWVDAKVDGQTTKAEVIVPEGHTAVRKLPGENSWLLLTSHVINAEEPQVIAPLKAPAAPQGEQKRYLVPVDDSPEPTELTGVPQFKAQAENFGLNVVRVRSALETGSEKGAASSEAQPELAGPVAGVEYQVAQAEPRHLKSVAVEPPQPPVVTGYVVETRTIPQQRPFMVLEKSVLVPEEKPSSTFEMYPRKSSPEEQPKETLMGYRFYQKQDEAPFRLWLGDMLENAEATVSDPIVPNPKLAHGFEIAPANEPPARLDVCLDEAECQPALKSPAPFSQVIDGVFVSPSPSFPVPWVKFDRPSPNATITVVPLEVGRRAILTKPKSSSPAYFSKNDVVIIPAAPSNQVQPASGTTVPVETIESHLTAAAVALEELGLSAEANVVQALLNSIHLRAQERCVQIDQEIARLKAARKKLEVLSNSEQAAGSESSTETR